MSESTTLTKRANIAYSNKLATSESAELMMDMYVYCPYNEENRIKKVLARHNIRFQINNYDIKPAAGVTICHYKSANLHKNERQFLIKMTEFGAWVEPLVSYLDRQLGLTEVELLHSGYFLHQKAFSLLSNKRNQVVKRLLDLFCVTLLGFIATPICLITAILIKIESPGPVFFKQRRTGLYNKEFDVIKFRSMRSDAEKNGAQWASKNDIRVTRIGKFIRKTRIDELPQLINVLKGEMSMVGPRPEREVFIEELEKVIPYYRFRHSVRPGITGLAQVKYAYGASVDDAIWKHKYDVYYIKHHDLFMDFKILWLTVKIVLFGMGR